MDAKCLETIRITALEHVQRCTPTCPSSTTCRYGHERSLLRFSEPSIPQVLRDCRFASKVARIYGCSAFAAPFDLVEPANDAALIELLLDGCTKRQAGSRALIEEANKANRPGPNNGRPRPSVAKNRSRSQGPSSMRLTERKRILIDIRRALHLGATFTSPPAHLSLETGQEDIYDMTCVAQTPSAVYMPVPLAPVIPGLYNSPRGYI